MLGNRFNQNFIQVLTAVALLCSLGACTGNRLNLKQKSTSSLVTGGSSSTFAIRLNAVVPQASNPSGNFSLAGDSSIGQYCYAVGGTPGVSGTGVSTCQCDYQFTVGTTSQQRNANTVSYSNNEIVCSYSSVIPSQANQVAVKIVASAAGASSNTLTVNLNGTGSNLFLDLTNPESFRKVQMYQARKLFEDILHPYCDDADNCPIDPIQTENYLLSFPVIFYSTNLGKTLLNYGNYSGENPETAPTHWSLGYSRNQAKVSFWQNHKIYSRGSSTQGSSSEGYLMYDAFGRSKNTRIDFELARGQTGVFQYEVTLPESPANLNIMGYAAAPITDAAGRLQCPEATGNIPIGKHWVLINLFKSTSSFDTVYAWRPAYLQQGPTTHTKIACNPGVVTGSSATSQPDTYVSCDGGRNLDTATSTAGEFTGSALTTQRAFYLSSASIANPAACFSVSPGANATFGMQRLDGYQNSTTGNASFSVLMHPWQLSPTNSSSQTGQENQINGSIITKTTTHSKGSYTGSNKDNIMVVYPTGLTNAEYESRKDEFTPLRYKNRLACDVGSATNPETGCPTSGAAIISYNLDDEAQQYPLCAVQED